MKYKTLIIGQISKDQNIDYDGQLIEATGGAVIYAAYAASALGHNIAVLPKAKLTEIDLFSEFDGANNVTIFPIDSNNTTSIQNIYHTADRERRDCRVLSRIQPYQVEDIPDINVKIYHLAGLMEGDITEDVIDSVAKRGYVALDVQAFLRYQNGEELLFHDWKNKLDYLPQIQYLKTDAAEAEVMTGVDDRVAAAHILYEWGAKEIMITHNEEVLVYNGENIFTRPLKPRNLSGRTGRGDTCFSAYINERLNNSIENSLRIAAALVSLKMETPGPFKGTRMDVEQFYQEQF